LLDLWTLLIRSCLWLYQTQHILIHLPWLNYCLSLDISSFHDVSFVLMTYQGLWLKFHLHGFHGVLWFFELIMSILYDIWLVTWLSFVIWFWPCEMKWLILIWRIKLLMQILQNNTGYEWSISYVTRLWYSSWFNPISCTVNKLHPRHLVFTTSYLMRFLSSLYRQVLDDVTSLIGYWSCIASWCSNTDRVWKPFAHYYIAKTQRSVFFLLSLGFEQS